MKKSLREEIKEFQKQKKFLVPGLIVFGLLGLVLPLLPGIALLFLAFLLLFPGQGNLVLSKIKMIFGFGEKK